MWDDLCRGAIGAIVLVDTARLDEAFSPLDYFESKGIPFIVAVNEFEGGPKYPLTEIREALALPDEVPIISLDARDRDSAKRALVRATEFALEKLMTAAAAVHEPPLDDEHRFVCTVPREKSHGSADESVFAFLHNSSTGERHLCT